MKGLSIYIAGGVTSNLFSALLPGFLDLHHKIWATIREPIVNIERIKALSDLGIKLISKEEGIQQSFDAVLWLSTHDDFEFLSQLAAKNPTLAISSAAIMDYYLGKETEDQLNSYKRSKLLLARIPNIVTLVPGFYIEDIPTPNWASKGLHGDTTLKLFDQNLDNSFDWNKMYSVTPKTSIVAIINEWLQTPNTFPKNQPVIACSDRAYRRWELRQMAGLSIPNNCLPAQPDAIYTQFMHPTTTISDECVRTSCNSRDQ